MNHDLTFILSEEFDEGIIDSALQINDVEFKAKDLEMHIIIAGRYYTWQYETLDSFVTKALEKLDLKSAMITQISMVRNFLITKENMEEICLGKVFITGALNT